MLFVGDCLATTGKKCQHGVCLDSQCHCDDGFGAKGCELRDLNECSLGVCDVFAHCTNTIGSFSCQCNQGYQGNGLQCTGESSNPTNRNLTSSSYLCFDLLIWRTALPCLNSGNYDDDEEGDDWNRMWIVVFLFLSGWFEWDAERSGDDDGGVECPLSFGQ